MALGQQLIVGGQKYFSRQHLIDCISMYSYTFLVWPIASTVENTDVYFYKWLGKDCNWREVYEVETQLCYLLWIDWFSSPDPWQ